MIIAVRLGGYRSGQHIDRAASWLRQIISQLQGKPHHRGPVNTFTLVLFYAGVKGDGFCVYRATF